MSRAHRRLLLRVNYCRAHGIRWFKETRKKRFKPRPEYLSDYGIHVEYVDATKDSVVTMYAWLPESPDIWELKA